MLDNPVGILGQGLPSQIEEDIVGLLRRSCIERSALQDAVQLGLGIMEQIGHPLIPASQKGVSMNFRILIQKRGQNQAAERSQDEPMAHVIGQQMLVEMVSRNHYGRGKCDLRRGLKTDGDL